MLSLRRTGERLLGRLPWGTPARRHKRRPFSSRFRRNQGASRQEKWPHAAAWAVPGGRAAQAPPSLFFSTALSLNRHAKRRDLNERPLVELLRKAGFLVHRNDRLCDLIVCDPRTGVITLLEVKNLESGKPRLTPDQREAVAAGWPLQIVTDPASALAAVRRTGPRSAPGSPPRTDPEGG